jgi:hypothetical protein
MVDGQGKVFVPGLPVWHFAAFDLNTPGGLQRLGEERFGDTANTITLLLHSTSPHHHLEAATAAVSRLLQANPFCSVSVILDIPHNAPLDLLDAIDATMAADQPSAYPGRMYASAYSHRPTRRMFVLVEAGQAGDDSAWLEDARDCAEIIWRIDCGSPEQALHAARDMDIPSSDFAFLGIPGSLSGNAATEFCTALAETSSDPSRIILPGIELQWRWAAMTLGRDGGGQVAANQSPTELHS